MARALNHRLTQCLIVLAVAAVLTQPRLGAVSLWDMDEGLNAEAAREMAESGNWVVPKFNFQLRDAKPALLYWLQLAAYRAFGVNEFAARLPSALAIAVTALLTCELGRRMFSPITGLLGGLSLLSTLSVSLAGRFANPDAVLLACTALTFCCFWTGYVPVRAGGPPRRGWFVPVGAACGLAMLAKGPVGIVLPVGAIMMFLVWQRQWRLLLDHRVLYGAAACALVAMPWYAMVSIETRGEFARGFFLKNNFGRFMAPMEDHRGPVYYHALVLLVGFAPWSVFLPLAIWYGGRACARTEPAERTLILTPAGPAHRLLLSWLVVYLLFFSASATKLPNYTLPLYPAIALLTARFLDRWRRSEIRPPSWLLAASVLLLLLIGSATIVGFLAASGEVRLPSMRGPTFPSLGRYWWIGLLPILGGLGAVIAGCARRRNLAVACVAAMAVGFLGAAAFPIVQLEEFKAARGLSADAGTCQRDREIRLATFQYTQPSLVFYNQREVRQLLSIEQAVEFLSSPLPAYLFVPEPTWSEIAATHPELPKRLLARRWDLYKRCPVVVVTNQEE